VKVETYLRICGIAYDKIHLVQNLSYAKSPTGQFPIIIHVDKVVADSDAILRYFEKEYKVPSFSKYTDNELNKAFLMQKTADHMYLLILYCRWDCDAASLVFSELFSDIYPPVIHALLKWQTIRATCSKLYEQGTGRRSPEELLLMTERVFNELSCFLGDKKYILGPTIHAEYDASFFGMMVQIVYVNLPGQDELTKFVWSESCANIRASVDRMVKEYFPEKVSFLKPSPTLAEE
jgi:glutathione S-transferase